MVARNILASVPRLYNVSLVAVFAFSAEAELFTGNKVGTSRIDLVDVDYSQLIPKARHKLI